VGWSCGAADVLEAAARSPERVASLTLHEPPIFTVPAAAGLLQVLAPAMAAWATGDAAGAVDRFHPAVWGPD
jgi:pimeloyl-ACP methyl ester carboxylesterase